MSKTYTLEDFLNIKHSFAPSFSPDSTKLAYLSNVTGTTQIYVTDIEGNSHQQITNYEDSVEGAGFSPADNCLIFGMSSGGNEKTQFYLYDLNTRETRDLTAKPDVNHLWGSLSRDGKYLAFASNERNGTDFDVYVMDIATKETRCVFTPEGWSEAYSFSPKGNYLIVTLDYSPADNDLYLVNLNTDESRHLTPHKGATVYAGSAWKPDESGFFLISNQNQDKENLMYYDLEASSLSTVIKSENETESVRITRDGQYLYVRFNQGGYAVPYIYDADTLEKISFDLPSNGLTHATWSQDGRHLAYQHLSSTQNTDIYTLDLEKNQTTQVTHSPSDVPSKDMVEPRLIEYESFDGVSIPAFIYEPRESKTKQPVVISIHGGPEGQYRPVLNPLAQYFVQHGYTYIAPNVRGSSGYGKHYMAMDDVKKRMDSVKDIVALHDYLIETDYYNQDKVVLEGGSYGGYMVLANLAFYPDRWAAGIDVAGIANIATFLKNTSPYRRKLREPEYGSLEKDREFLESISPSNYAENIRAPLFIIHGANDPRVPLSEAELIKSKVEDNGQKVELLVYEDEGHGLAKLNNRLDAYPKAVAFLDHVLG